MNKDQLRYNLLISSISNTMGDYINKSKERKNKNSLKQMLVIFIVIFIYLYFKTSI